MKNFKILLLLVIAVLGFNSCQENDDLEFTATPQGDFELTNTILPEYVLPADAVADDNIGVVFTWNEAKFDVQTNVSYELQYSLIGDFSDAANLDGLSATSENQITLNIGQLKNIAALAGFDNDPATTEPDTGDLTFRVRAYPGDSTSTTEQFSPNQPLTVRLLEATTSGGPSGVCDLDQLWLVGAGVPDAGWGWDTPVALACTGDNVYSGNVTFVNDAFRFFSTEGDWGSGTNYPTYLADGYTIDAIFADAMDGDNNFSFTGTPGTYYLEVDTINKTINLSAPQTTGTCNLTDLWIVGAGATDAGWGWTTPVQVSCTANGIYTADINLINDAFRIFTENGNWDSGQNYPWYITEGYTIDVELTDAMDGDNNFSFTGTPGNYIISIDTVNKTINLD